MLRLLLCFTIYLGLFWNYRPDTAVAKQRLQAPPGIIACYSGGKEILRREMVSGPFADEYKFAHEVRVRDETGEHSLNFAGGLCIIEREIPPSPKLTTSDDASASVSDRLSCYSGANLVVTFEIYGRETTVDEYVEGRTFRAKAQGTAFDSDTLREYLVFGGGACIGLETS